MKTLALTLAAIVAFCATSNRAAADTFGTRGNVFEISFVSVRHQDAFPSGSVDYDYKIGKYEISRDMIEKANAEGELGITMADMTNFGGNGPNKPATGLTWIETLVFINWLNSSSGHPVAYKLNDGTFDVWNPNDPGYDPDNQFRSRLAHYFLPSEDEWRKAAYHNPQAGGHFRFATGTYFSPPFPVSSGTSPHTAVYNQPPSAGPADVMQAGGLSAYGTMAQSGNIWEMLETENDRVNDNSSNQRIARGGDWEENAECISSRCTAGLFVHIETPPTFGFRVASIPEPGSLLLGVLGALGLLLRRRSIA